VSVVAAGPGAKFGGRSVVEGPFVLQCPHSVLEATVDEKSLVLQSVVLSN
jgi:hypothetical protein